MAFQFLAPIAGIFFGGFASMAMFGAGYGDILRRFFHNSIQGSIEDVGSALREYGKGVIDKDTLYSIMAQNGFKAEFTDRLVKANPDQLTPYEIVKIWFLHNGQPDAPFPVNSDWMIKRFSQAGMDTDILPEFLEANRPIPTLDDIIRFAAREAFEPEAIAQGDLLQGIPKEFVRESERRGLKKQEAEWYWIAHWEIPGVQQVFEMFQRLHDHPDPDVQFTQEDLDTYYNIADIAPGYRKRLNEISYIPLGRVDIRRAWRFGVFNQYDNPREALIRAFREIGYNQKDAIFQADFAEAEAEQANRSDTKSVIMTYWREGIYGNERDEKAKEALQKIKYSESDANNILELERLKEITANEQSEIDDVTAQYVNGRINTTSQLRASLAEIGLTSSHIDKLVIKITKERTKVQTKLTRAQLEKMFNEGIINEPTFREALKVNNYSDTDINRIVALLKTTVPVSVTRAPIPVIVGWWESQIISEEQFLTKMKSAGVPSDEIVLYAISTGNALSETTQSTLLQ